VFGRPTAGGKRKGRIHQRGKEGIVAQGVGRIVWPKAVGGGIVA
jgi:hypothetical protein